MRNSLFSLCVLLSGWLSTHAQSFIAPIPSGPDPVTLARIEEWTRVLVNELDYLQEDITSDLAGQTQQQFSRLRREALRDTLGFRQALKRGTSHHRLNIELQRLDGSINAIYSALQNLPARLRSLQRTGRRIRLAGGQIGYFVSNTNPWADSEKSLLRQTTLLESAATELGQITKSFSNSAFGRRIHSSVEHYCEHLAGFRGKLRGNTNLRVLQKEYSDITDDWNSVNQNISRVKPTNETTNLIARAQHVADLHYELGRLVNRKPHDHNHGIGDDRPVVGIPQIPVPGSGDFNRFRQSLQGTWSLEFMQANGQLAKGREPRSTFVINGNRWSVRYAGGNPTTGTFKIVAKGRGHYDADFYIDGQRTPMLTCIKLEGELFHYCSTSAEQGRPTRFSAPRGNKAQSYSVWRKIRR